MTTPTPPTTQQALLLAAEVAQLKHAITQHMHSYHMHSGKVHLLHGTIGEDGEATPEVARSIRWHQGFMRDHLAHAARKERQWKDLVLADLERAQAAAAGEVGDAGERGEAGGTEGV